MAGLKLELRPTSRGRSLAALGAPKRSRARGHLRAASIAERTRASKFGLLAHAACLALGGRRLPLPHSFSIMFIRSPRAAVGWHAPSVSLRPTSVRHDILLTQEPRVFVVNLEVPVYYVGKGREGVGPRCMSAARAGGSSYVSRCPPLSAAEGDEFSWTRGTERPSTTRAHARQ